MIPTIRLTADNTLENSGIMRWNCTAEHISDSVLEVLPTCSRHIPDQNSQKLEQEQLADSNKPSEEPAATITKAKEPQKGYLARDLARHIKNGENDLIEKMLADGVHFDGEPLIAAVEANRFDLVHQFLSKGADANSVDLDGYSLLQTAIFNSKAYQRKDLDIIRLLLNSGASTSYVSPSNQTALLSLHIPNQLKYTEPNNNITEEEKNKNSLDLQLSYEIAKLLLSHEAKSNRYRCLRKITTGTCCLGWCRQSCRTISATRSKCRQLGWKTKISIGYCFEKRLRKNGTAFI